jgi:hypothetical protein
MDLVRQIITSELPLHHTQAWFSISSVRASPVFRRLSLIQSFSFPSHTVIHGYVQSAATVAGNTRALKDKLSNIAILHYVDGPPMCNASQSSSRPWWILDSNLEHDMRASDRWDDTVCFHLTAASHWQCGTTRRG